MSSYLAAVLIALLILLLATVESWYRIVRDCFAMLLVYSVVAGLALTGLWWIGGL